MYTGLLKDIYRHFVIARGKGYDISSLKKVHLMQSNYVTHMLYSNSLRY